MRRGYRSYYSSAPLAPWMVPGSSATPPQTLAPPAMLDDANWAPSMPVSAPPSEAHWTNPNQLPGAGGGSVSAAVSTSDTPWGLILGGVGLAAVLYFVFRR